MRKSDGAPAEKTSEQNSGNLEPDHRHDLDVIRFFHIGDRAVCFPTVDGGGRGVDGFLVGGRVGGIFSPAEQAKIMLRIGMPIGDTALSFSQNYRRNKYPPAKPGDIYLHGFVFE